MYTLFLEMKGMCPVFDVYTEEIFDRFQHFFFVRNVDILVAHLIYCNELSEYFYGSLPPPIYIPCKLPARVNRIIR
jgi:hypothetical protein